MSEYTHFEETIEYPNGKVTIRIVPDFDLESPSDRGDCAPEFFIAGNGRQLAKKLESEFTYPGTAYNTLSYGCAHDQAGDWYYGFSKYEHGQIALAFCRSAKARSWPDQQWDVVPLVGWVKITKKLREAWGIGDDEDKVKVNAECCLKEWEAYLNVEGWGYIVTRTGNEGNEIDEDSCFGYYFMEDAKSDAEAAARDMLRRAREEG